MDRFEILDWVVAWTTLIIRGEDLGRIGLVLIVSINGLWLRIEEKVWGLGAKDSRTGLGING